MSRRVYYIGTGVEFEGSEDGGKTWQTFIRCKTVDFNGSTLVWAPAGMKAVRKSISTKHPFLLHVQTGQPMLEKNRTIFVAEPGGPDDSFLDLTADQLAIVSRAANWDGLVHESEYERRLSPDALRARAEKLLAAAEKADLAPKKKAPAKKKPAED